MTRLRMIQSILAFQTLDEKETDLLGVVNCHSAAAVKQYYIKKHRKQLARDAGVVKVKMQAEPMRSAYLNPESKRSDQLFCTFILV